MKFKSSVWEIFISGEGGKTIQLREYDNQNTLQKTSNESDICNAFQTFLVYIL